MFYFSASVFHQGKWTILFDVFSLSRPLRSPLLSWRKIFALCQSTFTNYYYYYFVHLLKICFGRFISFRIVCKSIKTLLTMTNDIASKLISSQPNQLYILLLKYGPQFVRRFFFLCYSCCCLLSAIVYWFSVCYFVLFRCSPFIRYKNYPKEYMAIEVWCA